MDFKDYYEILGISADADQKAIKSAYRKLARQYHPDVNPGNKESEEKFKTINEAYQALSDPEQRKKYDELRVQYQRWQQSGGRGQDFDWQRWTTASGEGARVRYATAEDMEDLFGTDNPYSDFFTSIFGQARPRQARPRSRRGQDVEAEVEVTLEEAYQGASRLLQIGDRRIEAKIPPGVRTGSRVRLSGQGEPGVNGGQPGDIYLIVRVAPHSTFEREGDDLYTEVPIDIYTAALGGEARVPTLDRDVVLKIPARTQAGRSFRLKGKGMPRLGSQEARGDLYARARLVLPEPLTDHELEVLRTLADERQKVKR
jgi:curved DNA-binding protein